jgi:chromosome segregation ATPase
LQTQYDHVQREAGQEIATFQRRLSEAQENHDASLAALAKLQAEHRASLAALAKLQAEHKQDRDEIANLQGQLSESQGQHDLSVATLARLQAEHDEFRNESLRERENLSERLSEQTAQNSAALAANNKLESDLEAAWRLLSDARAEGNALRDARARLESSLSALRQALAQNADEMSVVTQARDELAQAVFRQVSEIARLDRIAASLRKTVTEADQQKDSQRAETEAIRAELQNLKLVFASADSDFALERQRLHSQIVHLEKAFKDAQLSPFWRMRTRIDRLLRALRLRRRPIAPWERRDSAN